MRELFSLSSIRGKMILAFFMITLVFGITNIYSQINSRKGFEKSSGIIQEYTYLNGLSEDITNLEVVVEKYLATKSSAALIGYYNISGDLYDKVNSISRKRSYDDYETMIKDIAFMTDEFLKEADKAINAKRGRSSKEYNAHFLRTYKISNHIRFYIDKLLNSKLKTGAVEYEMNNLSMKHTNVVNVILVIVVTIMSIIVGVLFTYRLTKPIIKLSNAAEQISRGKYDIEEIRVDTHDEINTLAKGFSKMAGSIKKHIEGIQDQAATEKKLKEQEMQNLKMKNLLKEAELKSLQSQINPHFLFNTLNAASQLSVIEGAERSSEFILKAAELFRYSLRKLDEPVTILDEVNNVRAYMYILKTRFGDRITFSIEVDENIESVKVPCTIIQPIVENAYIHGLQNVEDNGWILLKVEDREKFIIITVKDNGEGMDKNKINEIFKSEKGERKKAGVSGIGTRNVIDRLKLFYGIDDMEDIIQIKSKRGKGTEVIMKIPKQEINNIKSYGV